MEPELNKVKTLGVRISATEIDEIAQAARDAIASGQDWVVFNTGANLLFLDELGFCENRAIAADTCWEFQMMEGEWFGIPTTAFLEALNGAREGAGISPAGTIELTFPGQQVTGADQSLKTANFQELSRQLEAMGLYDKFTEYELKAGMFEGNENFQLHALSASPTNDIIQYVFHFGKGAGEKYQLNGYDGVLRKASSMPDSKAKALEERMHAIDWDIVLLGEELPVEKLPAEIQRIITDVDALSSSGRLGRMAADNLKFRYWTGTALEGLVPNHPQLREAYMTSHHFAGPELAFTAMQAYGVLSALHFDKIRVEADKHLNQMLNSNLQFMEKDNMEFLQDNLKYMGFGDKLQLNKQLEEQVAKGAKEFQLNTHATFGKDDKMDLTLHFRRSDTSGLYFFNKYDARLTNERTDQNGRSQTFYTNNGITLKEAYNLLDGRVVNKDLTNKEGGKYNAWIKLDPTQKDRHGNFEMKRYTEGYGFDVEKHLARLPVAEADPNHPNHQRTLYSLRKGNLTEVHGAEDKKYFITANPPGGGIDVFDENRKPVDLRRPKVGENRTSGQENGVAQTQSNTTQDKERAGKEHKNSNKQPAGGDELEGKSNKRRARR